MTQARIGQSFVRNIPSSPENEVIVDTIIAMAQQLNLKIVAEGIESPELGAHSDKQDYNRQVSPVIRELP